MSVLSVPAILTFVRTVPSDAGDVVILTSTTSPLRTPASLELKSLTTTPFLVILNCPPSALLVKKI